jgi:dienelactone hydrolase
MRQHSLGEVAAPGNFLPGRAIIQSANHAPPFALMRQPDMLANLIVVAPRRSGFYSVHQGMCLRTSCEGNIMTRRMVLAACVLAFGAGAADAAVKSKVVTYAYDGVTLKGFLAWDDAVTGKRPGVLVVHEWWGLNDYARKRAEELAKLGYVAFACDMYGDGKSTEHPKEAGQFAGEVRKNLKTWQGRALAGLKVLQESDLVDGQNLAAIGYCFGGSTALQLAYMGAPLKAVATFHAALPVPTPEQAKAIKPRILICHGADDSFITKETIDSFKTALDTAKADYQFKSYEGAVHSFSVPGAEKAGVKGLAYNAAADEQSWAAMQSLFRDTMKVTKK